MATKSRAEADLFYKFYINSAGAVGVDMATNLMMGADTQGNFQVDFPNVITNKQCSKCEVRVINAYTKLSGGLSAYNNSFAITMSGAEGNSFSNIIGSSGGVCNRVGIIGTLKPEAYDSIIPNNLEIGLSGQNPTYSGDGATCLNPFGKRIRFQIQNIFTNLAGEVVLGYEAYNWGNDISMLENTTLELGIQLIPDEDNNGIMP
tara:strand:+ start:44 stop:655 length:612 start_codon:yes stop_codon:yes gene_type:complete